MKPRPFSAALVVSLARVNLSLFVAFTALSAYIYYRHAIIPQSFFLFSGVFLLACAASAMNQLQERKIDLIMERTKTRPLPAMRMRPIHVAFFVGIAGCGGISLLYFGTNSLSALIGALALFVYNVIYTPLKTRTPFGLLFGAITGSLPVLVGVAAAVGRIDARAMYIAIFVFLWQVPHFLLLLVRYQEDYRRAGFSTLLSHMSLERVRNITVIWLLAACGTTALFPIIGIVRTMPLVAIVACMNVWMIIKIFRAFTRKTGFPSHGTLYVYQGIIFAVLIFQGLVR
jgi:protoheme IX farnesyltransferase